MKPPKKLEKLALMLLLLIYATTTLASPTSKIIMGFESGELRRCKLANMTDCTTLSEQDSPIFSVAVAGEFIYVGLESGELRRCTLFHPSNCTTFHELDSEIYAITVFKKDVYVGTNEGITKCGLRKSENCEKFYESETPIYSLVAFERTLYAGTDSLVLGCSLEVAENCTILTNTTSAVNALAVAERKLYLGLKEGSVQFGEIDNITDCFSLFETHDEVKDLDVFEEKIVTSLSNGKIIWYSFDTNEVTTVDTENSYSPALSLFTIYNTTPVKRHYIGENNACTWQFFACPPYIVYYDINSRAQLELHVKDGLIYDSKDELFDTRAARYSHSGRSAIFVMDSAGKIFASNQHPIFLLHHSSLMNGMPAASAGELNVTDGVINSVSSCSGHYRPTVALTKQIVSSLRRQGYDRNVTVIDCSLRKDLLIDLDFQKSDFYYKAKYEEYSLKMKKINN